MSVECGNNARTDGGHELVGEHVYILLTIGVFGLFMYTATNTQRIPYLLIGANYHSRTFASYVQLSHARVHRVSIPTGKHSIDVSAQCAPRVRLLLAHIDHMCE
jgi:hypothetical protein